MMEQLVEHLLAAEDPKKIFFIRADNAGLNAISKSPIEDSLQVYQEYVLKEEISSIKYRIFVLIDEVQKVESWTQSVKSWYDTNKKIKFIIFEFFRKLLGFSHDRNSKRNPQETHNFSCG